MNPQKSEPSPANLLADRRYQFTTSIRKQQRDTQIMKCRMQNLQSMSNSKQQESYSQINHRQFSIEEAPTLFQCLYSGQEEKVIFALVGFRKLLAEDLNADLIGQIFNSNVYDTIFKIAQDTRMLKKQMEANWILANLATGSADQINIMIKKGIIQHISNQLKQAVPAIDEQIVYLVGNIAGTGEKYMEMFINNGVLMQIIQVYYKIKNEEVKRSTVWVISNILRGEKPLDEETIDVVVPLLVKELKVNYDEERNLLLKDLSWSLWKISSRSRAACLIILKQNALQALVKLAEIDSSFMLSCIRVIGSVSLKLDSENDILVNCGVMDFLKKHLYHPQQIIRKQACWVLSNFSAGTRLQAESILSDDETLRRLEEIFFTDDSIDVRINAAWTISNFMAKIDAKFVYPIFERTIKGYIELCSQDRNLNAIDIGLRGIQNYLILVKLLETRDDPDVIANKEEVRKLFYQLQSHPSKALANKVNQLIVNFIEPESDNDDDIEFF